MIIFGTRTSSFRQSNLTSGQCRHCGTPASVHLQFATRYFHLFWIPAFPIGKPGISECSHCKQVLYLNEMPSEMLESYREAKKQAKTPLKYFALLLLAGLFVSFAVYAGLTTRNNNIAYLNTPRVGDVYEIEEDENYTLYKIAAVSNDSITVHPNEYEASSLSEFRRLKKSHKDDYADVHFNIGRNELPGMLRERIIRKINRE